MAYRNKTYVAFDGDEDMHYYRMMQAWAANSKIDFNFYNAHDLNAARDSSMEESIKRQLRERLKNSKVLIVLVGAKIKNLYKFVRWEIEQALNLGMPIIVVNLNGKRQIDEENCPPIIRDSLAVHISFNIAIIQYALNNWCDEHMTCLRLGEIAPFRYASIIYKQLGI
jgi:hypothetical protein